MQFNSNDSGSSLQSEINITPLVDVVLVLLVIMMVSATYIVSQSLKVDLPKAASQTDSVASIAAVTISKEGKLYFNQRPVSETLGLASEHHRQRPFPRRKQIGQRQHLAARPRSVIAWTIFYL